MLNAKIITKMMGDYSRVAISSEIIDCKPPSKNSVDKVSEVFNAPMSTKSISDLAGLSIPTVLLVMKFMRHYGDAITSKGVNTPTGNYNLLGNAKLKPIQTSNTGVTGVSFVASTKTFHANYKGRLNIAFNNLLDAACKRKSLELSN